MEIKLTVNRRNWTNGQLQYYPSQFDFEKHSDGSWFSKYIFFGDESNYEKIVASSHVYCEVDISDRLSDRINE